MSFLDRQWTLNTTKCFLLNRRVRTMAPLLPLLLGDCWNRTFVCLTMMQKKYAHSYFSAVFTTNILLALCTQHTKPHTSEQQALLYHRFSPRKGQSNDELNTNMISIHPSHVDNWPFTIVWTCWAYSVLLYHPVLTLTADRSPYYL